MTKRVIQTSPDIGLTIRLPKRQTVVQQVGTVAAAPGAPVWLGWQGQGGEACARLIYPTLPPDISDSEFLAEIGVRLHIPEHPLWPFPQAWIAGVPPLEKQGDDWRVCQDVTWRVRARVRLRVVWLVESTEGGSLYGSKDESYYTAELTDEVLERIAVTLLDEEVEISTTPALWPDFPWEIPGYNNTNTVECDEVALCQWTAPPEGMPLVPPRSPAPNGRQWLDVPFDALTEWVRYRKGFIDGARSLYRFALPAVWQVPHTGTLLVSTVTSDSDLDDPPLDIDLYATAYNAEGRALGEVSLRLPTIQYVGSYDE